MDSPPSRARLVASEPEQRRVPRQGVTTRAITLSTGKDPS